MITFTQFLIESRKNPEQNKKTSPLDKLKEYAKKYSNVFVTFTTVPKLGINPSSEYETPVGVCSYPIDYVIENQILNVPFAGFNPYLVVFKPKEYSSILVLDDKTQLESAIIRVNRVLTKKGYDTFEATNSVEFMHGIYLSITNNESKGSKKSQATNILRAAGYSGIFDNGKGAIHENEPTQAIFFEIKNLTKLDIIYNSDSLNQHKGKVSREKEKEEFRSLFGDEETENMYDESDEDLADTNIIELIKAGGNRARWLEPLILKQPRLAVEYAANVIKGRWPALENILKSDPRACALYCWKVMNKRVPELESTIKQNNEAILIYSFNVIKGRWPEIEQQLKGKQSFVTGYNNWWIQYKKMWDINESLVYEETDTSNYLKQHNIKLKSTKKKLAKKLGVSLIELSKLTDIEIKDVLKNVGEHDFYPNKKFDPSELKKGIKVELEHTKSKLIATLIAKDHLSELSDYYTRLEKMERGE